MKQYTTKTIFIISLVLLLASAFAYGYIYLAFNGLLTNIKNHYDNHAQSSAMLGELNLAEQNLNDTIASKNRISSFFVKQASIVNFIQIIESMMKRTGIHGSVDSVSEEEIGGGENKDKEKLVLILTADGDWANLTKFVGLLERISYKSSIDSLSLNLASAKTGTGADQKIVKGKWQIKLTMQALVLKTAEAHQ